MDDSDSYRKIKDEGLEIRGQYLTQNAQRTTQNSKR